jgi:2-polyprenyl-3-methyl-5-hydroxy-6-metoxy-1,4-benzoquinol methylase
MITNTLTPSSQNYAEEVAQGKRFEFGKNWSNFLSVLDDERIANAEESLCEMLEVQNLNGKTFLDIGSGSGLFSLAARRLGAKVHSFDFDPKSVACTTELRRRYFENDKNWTIEQNSALDENYVKSLGKFDIVYSWGVLHHTGDMWKGLENASFPVAENGKIFVAIYNDAGTKVARWHWIKKTYCGLPNILKTPFAVVAMLPDELKKLCAAVIMLKPANYLRSWTQHENGRGMNRWYDIIDWVGGYPYEVASPEELFEFYKAKGFSLTKLKSKGAGLGCVELVMQKTVSDKKALN